MHTYLEFHGSRFHDKPSVSTRKNGKHKTDNIPGMVNYYLHKHPVKLEDITQDNEKILDAKNRIRKRLQEYIERLRSMDIEDGEDGKEYILFVHKMQQDGAEEDAVSLVCRQELRDKGLEAETYSYVFDRQAKIMGFKVSDAAYC